MLGKFIVLLTSIAAKNKSGYLLKIRQDYSNVSKRAPSSRDFNSTPMQTTLQPSPNTDNIKTLQTDAIKMAPRLTETFKLDFKKLFK